MQLFHLLCTMHLKSLFIYMLLKRLSVLSLLGTKNSLRMYKSPAGPNWWKWKGMASLSAFVRNYNSNLHVWCMTICHKFFYVSHEDISTTLFSDIYLFKLSNWPKMFCIKKLMFLKRYQISSHWPNLALGESPFPQQILVSHIHYDVLYNIMCFLVVVDKTLLTD